MDTAGINPRILHRPRETFRILSPSLVGIRIDDFCAGGGSLEQVSVRELLHCGGSGHNFLPCRESEQSLRSAQFHVAQFDGSTGGCVRACRRGLVDGAAVKFLGSSFSYGVLVACRIAQRAVLCPGFEPFAADRAR